jgi:hypothetical protein
MLRHDMDQKLTVATKEKNLTQIWSPSTKKIKFQQLHNEIINSYKNITFYIMTSQMYTFLPHPHMTGQLACQIFLILNVGCISNRLLIWKQNLTFRKRKYTVI